MYYKFLMTFLLDTESDIAHCRHSTLFVVANHDLFILDVC